MGQFICKVFRFHAWLTGSFVMPLKQAALKKEKDPFWADLFQGATPNYEKGFALPPDKPGLGVGFDEAVAAKRPYTPHTRQQLRVSDGGIADH